ncbi:hypothetical protein FQA39_LY04541 [Lamprigera yunnana]|nr:hypothetical protein FQA39_LY04541 [Lamprigera yunnana]
MRERSQTRRNLNIDKPSAEFLKYLKDANVENGERENRVEENKRPKRKLEVVNHSNSSSNESDAISFHDNSDEDLSDEFEDVNRNDLNNGDFVLVKFNTKTKLIHFVGQILNISEETSKIRFLRRKRLSTTFYFLFIDDISEIANEDIMSKLKTPPKSGTTRTASFSTSAIILILWLKTDF